MFTNFVKIAAEKARDFSEEYFKLQNVDMAIKFITAAKQMDPDLPRIDEYYTAYMVHNLISMKKSWYEILAIDDPGVDSSTIKKQYKKLALMLHPDKNPCKAAEGAFKIVKSGFDVLSNPLKRKAYDNCLKSNKRATNNDQFSSKESAPRKSSSSPAMRRSPNAAPKPTPGTKPNSTCKHCNRNFHIRETFANHFDGSNTRTSNDDRYVYVQAQYHKCPCR